MRDTTSPRRSFREIDTSTPSVARVYDALLGGKDNFAVDRALLDKMIAIAPETPFVVRENRAWQGRVLRWLTAEVGIDQYLDLGSGLPTAENTHQVVQQINPGATVVYVDNDPAVRAFGHALLEDSDRTHFVDADLTDPTALLAHPTITDHLELSRPLGLIQGMTLHYVPDELAAVIMTTYIDAMSPGSYVALSHDWLPARDGDPTNATILEVYARYAELIPALTPRTEEGILALLPGLEVVEPGLVPLHDWWPNGPHLRPMPATATAIRGVVARKP